MQASVGPRRAQQLLALESGAFDIELQYQVPVTKKDAESGFVLPAQFGLVNQLTLTLANLDVDVVSPQAVSIERKTAGKDTVATLVLAPVNDIWIGWKPRSRDVAREKAVFLRGVYAALRADRRCHRRPAPRGHPTGAGRTGRAAFRRAEGRDDHRCHRPREHRASKREGAAFRRLAMAFRSRHRQAARESHAAAIASVRAAHPLADRHRAAAGFEQSVGLISVENAAGQIGLLGVATGNEVQLDTVTAETLSPINLEDFPGNVAPVLAAQIPGLTVRRAFRYADAKATAALKASAVEPDVRVETQDTLSLGEDRAVLAANATVDITRAGHFPAELSRCPPAWTWNPSAARR